MMPGVFCGFAPRIVSKVPAGQSPSLGSHLILLAWALEEALVRIEANLRYLPFLGP